MSVIWNVWLFVHISTHAMANIFANYAIAGILGNRLHSMTDVA